MVAACALFSFHTIGLLSRDHPAVVEMWLRHLADIHLTAGQPERAIAALQEAARGCRRGSPGALADLFQADLRTGRVAEGETGFRLSSSG